MDGRSTLLRLGIVHDRARWPECFEDLLLIDLELVSGSMKRLARSRDLLDRVQAQVDRAARLRGAETRSPR